MWGESATNEQIKKKGATQIAISFKKKEHPPPWGGGLGD